MKMPGLVLFLSILLKIVWAMPVGFSVDARSQSLDHQLLDRFKSEAPHAWEKSKENFARFFEENDGWLFEWQRTISESGELHEKSGTVKRVGISHGLVEGFARSLPNKQTAKRSATMYNPQYAAQINRASIDQPWVLERLTRIDHDYASAGSAIAEILNSQYPLSAVAVDVSKSTRHPYGICPFEIEDFFKKTWFELDGLEFRSIQEIHESGNELVEVKLKYQSKVIKGNVFANMERSCTALFDPNQNWCLRHVESKHRYEDEESKTVIDYDYRTISGVQFCTKKELREFLGSDETYSEEYRDEITMTNFHPSEFSLSSYGLKEPDWYIPPRPWWMYASLIGMVLLLAGAILLRYGKKLLSRN